MHAAMWTTTNLCAFAMLRSSSHDPVITRPCETARCISWRCAHGCSSGAFRLIIAPGDELVRLIAQLHRGAQPTFFIEVDDASELGIFNGDGDGVGAYQEGEGSSELAGGLGPADGGDICRDGAGGGDGSVGEIGSEREP